VRNTPRGRTSPHSSLNSSTASVLSPPLTLALVSAIALPCERATALMNWLSGTRMPACARQRSETARGVRRAGVRAYARQPRVQLVAERSRNALQHDGHRAWSTCA
jgi:hypothetical protein